MVGNTTQNSCKSNVLNVLRFCLFLQYFGLRFTSSSSYPAHFQPIYPPSTPFIHVLLNFPVISESYCSALTESFSRFHLFSFATFSLPVFTVSLLFISVSRFLFLSLYNAFLKRYDFSGVGFLVDRCKEAPRQDTAVAAALWISVPRLLTQRPASQSSQLKSHFLSRKK